MQLIPAALAAKAMKVSAKSIHLWFAAHELAGEQTTSGRLFVSIASCRALIQKKRGPNSPAEAEFDRVLHSRPLPRTPFSHGGADAREGNRSYA